MPIQNINGKEIAVLTYGYSAKYWPLLSEYVKATHGKNEVKDPSEVQAGLKGCFKLLGDSFMALVNSQKKASFYIFVQYLHENSIDIYKEQLKGYKIPINESDFAVSRRVIKIILEQSVTVDLIGHDDFFIEIKTNQKGFTQLLDELLYLGSWAIQISEYVARSQLFPKSVGVHVEEDGVLSILTYSPYKSLYEYIDQDIPRHNESVTVYNTLQELIEIWRSIGISFNSLSSFLQDQITNPRTRFAVFPVDGFIEHAAEQLKYDPILVKDFYDGLTVTRENVLSFEDCILRNQDVNRHILRPVLKIKIDDVYYFLVSINKWQESLTVLSTNSLPWGTVPDEWKKHKKIKDFVQHLESTHDDILEDAAVKLLDERKIIFDKSIKSLKTRKGNNINIDRLQGVGEFDLMFLDKENLILYVCECKHNRSRFDMFNWKRDYSNFKSKYEKQLTNKVIWSKKNTAILLEHLEIIWDIEIESKKNYNVKGLFIINAPTFYMYDAIYPTLTLHDLSSLIKNTYHPALFAIEDDDGRVYHINRPYFQNLDQLMVSLGK